MTSLAVHPVDLEPSRVAHRMYATRRRSGRIDSATLLCLQVAVLDLFPARMILPNLTMIGRPALVLGLLMWSWWAIAKFNRSLAMNGPQPMRWVVLAFAVSMLASYAAGYLRGLPTLEANGANLAMLWTAEFTGVILMTADGLPSWERLNTVLRAIVLCSAFMAVVGILQSVLDLDVTRYLILPGFQLKGDLAGFSERGNGFFRVASTATHYIEFSSVMALSLPYAIHLARFSPTRRRRHLFVVAALLIAAAIPLTLSRTGIVASAAAMLVMVPAWNWRMRYNMLVITATLVAAFMVVRPGLMGTLKALFQNASSSADPSIKGRTDDYADVMRYFSERPLLGRGPGTFIPILYRILDNQWLGTLVTNGIIGVVVIAGMHITCVILAVIALRRSKQAAERHLCAALISSQVIAVLVAGTFDSLGFSTYAFNLALLMGLCGAVWRLTHSERTVRTSTAGRGKGWLDGTAPPLIRSWLRRFQRAPEGNE